MPKEEQVDEAAASVASAEREEKGERRQVKQDEEAVRPSNLLDRHSSSLDRLLTACERDDLAHLVDQVGGQVDVSQQEAPTPKEVSSMSIDFDKYDRILAQLLA